jgi:hypothetical protein
MSYGFVYVLANRAMPGIYKIGYTDRSPTLRRNELSRGTSVPLEFDLICYAEYDDAKAMEQEVHGLLAHARMSANREFFKCDLVEITDLVMNEEEAASLCPHQMDPFLYDESPKFRERLRAAKQMSRDVGIEVVEALR